MKFVEDARDWWRWNSVHAAALISTAMLTWSELPPPMREQLVEIMPSWVMIPISVLTFAGMVLARVRAQPKAER